MDQTRPGRAATAAERDPGVAPKPPGRPNGRHAPKPTGREVSYSGRIFRSQLEARWAAFLDLLEVNWDYEPSFYQVGPKLWYLPDFYLPDLGTWLEVKGTYFMDAASMAKVVNAVAGPMRIPMREDPYEMASHLLLGGAFGPFDDGQTPVHTIVFRRDEGEAGFKPVTFRRVGHAWMLTPAAADWGSMKATGVQARTRPPKPVVLDLLEPNPMVGQADDHLAWAYRAARRLVFDDAQRRLLAAANDSVVLTSLSRRRAGRPLPKPLWPKNMLRI